MPGDQVFPAVAAWFSHLNTIINTMFLIILDADKTYFFTGLTNLTSYVVTTVS